MKNTISFLCLFLIVTTTTAQNYKLPVFITDSLDKYIVKGIEDWKIPGLAVAIVKDGKTILAKGYGTTSIKTAEPITENTLFQIGSITKSFTATTASILHEEKKIDLNDKVTKWLPYFKLKDSLITREINITDLLSHRIGFDSYKGDLVYYLSDFDRKEVVEKMALLEINKKFRASYGYSNSAYTAVGEIIEKANGKSWEKTVRESILEPLQMDRTVMTFREKQNLINIAKPHSIINDKIEVVDYSPMDYSAPAGGMLSSVKDLSNWLIAQLYEGQFQGKEAISSMAIRRTRGPFGIQGFDQSNNARTHFYTYGLGIFVRDIDGVLTYQHSGGITGFSTNHIIIPKKELAIVILTNNDTNNFYLDLMNVIIDAFFELPFTDYSSESLKEYETEMVVYNKELDSLKILAANKHKPSLPINEFLGIYENESYGKIELLQQSNTLKILLSNQKDVIGTLNYIGDDKFLCSFSQYEFGIVTIPFKIESNTVIGFELLLENMESNSYSFLKKK